MSDSTPSIALASIVYEEPPRWDDPAETYHEASRLHPATALAQLPGLAMLASEPALVESTRRAARSHRHRPGIELPPARSLAASLHDALARRRSQLPHRAEPLTVDALATLLATAYASGDGGHRGVPSGGALYPLELYVAPLAVEGVAPAIYHYDPYAHRLALLAETAPQKLADALVDAEPLNRSACVVAVTAVFWRSRFKYGQRAYRFALLEAGHLAQAMLLVATALELPALPVGGFYDARVDAVLGVDGVDEASLYLLLIGGGA